MIPDLQDELPLVTESDIYLSQYTQGVETGVYHAERTNI